MKKRKLKTNRGAAKRFKVRASGSIKRKSANRRHILTKKSTARKRQLRAPNQVAKSDELAINRLLCVV